jgi:hypothetical protein
MKYLLCKYIVVQFRFLFNNRCHAVCCITNIFMLKIENNKLITSDGTNNIISICILNINFMKTCRNNSIRQNYFRKYLLFKIIIMICCKLTILRKLFKAKTNMMLKNKIRCLFLKKVTSNYVYASYLCEYVT